MRQWTESDGFETLEKDGDRHWLIVMAHSSAANAGVGDQVMFGGVLYRVTSVGRPYKHTQYRPKVCRVYVAGAEDVPATGGATEAQVTALRNFGVDRITANAASKAQASDWIDELLIAKSMTDSETAIRRVVSRIHQIGE